MPINTITTDKLARLIGTPKCPVLLDVRPDEDFAADPTLIPGALRRASSGRPDWSPEIARPGSVVICRHGSQLSHGIAAWLRGLGIAAEVLEGGADAWREAGLPRLCADRLPPRDEQGRTAWVTRERPKVDRIACPWLIRRFVDPLARFMFVAPAAVLAVAEGFRAAPFDVTGAFFGHRDDKCTFDVMLEEFGLTTGPLLRLASIVRGADTARYDLAPESAGLLAVSLGLSRMYADDLAQLEAGMGIYDALYRWCRDASDETHHHSLPRVEARRTARAE